MRVAFLNINEYLIYEGDSSIGSIRFDARAYDKYFIPTDTVHGKIDTIRPSAVRKMHSLGSNAHINTQ